MARPAPPIPGSSTHSSGGTQPPGTSATTHGDTPPAGHVTDPHTGEGDTNGTTATGNSGGSTSTSSTATGNDTHTASTNAQPSSTGTGIPLSTTSPQEIDLARKITANLDKVQAKRPLNPRQQADYDKARNLLDRAAPNQPGTRNTSNPKDLVLAGDGPISQTHDAAAEVPPAAPAQGASAVGTTIQSPGTKNPNAPTASAGGLTPPTPPVPMGAPQTTGTTIPSSASPANGSTQSLSKRTGPPTTNSGSAATNTETANSPSDYPHAVDGDYRGNWKTSTPGRHVKFADGREGVITAVANDHTLTVNVDGKRIAGVPQQKLKMKLTPDELAAEQAFIKRNQSFQKLKPIYDQRLADIAKTLPEAHVILAPLKGAPRALEKVGKAAKRKGTDGKSPSPEKAISKLTDMLRGSIVVDSIDQVPQATSAVLRSFAPDAKLVGTNKWGGQIYRTGDGRKVIVNDRFKNPTAEGYSDVQIMLEITPGHMVETQIHIPEMIVAKEGEAVKKMGLPEKYWPENLPINGFDWFFGDWRVIRGRVLGQVCRRRTGCDGGSSRSCESLVRTP